MALHTVVQEEIRYGKTDGMMFRQLDAKDVAEFEQYAREFDPPKLEWLVYHPVCRAIWMERGFRPGIGPDAKLAFGLNGEAPPTARAVWGARAIATQNGSVELVWDRQDMIGDDSARAHLAEWLNNGANAQWMARARELLSSYEMSTRDAQTFTLLDNADGVVKADTRGSAGYLYVVAWRK